MTAIVTVLRQNSERTGMTFSSLGLKQELLGAIAAIGFQHPTPIQAQAISEIINGDTDLIGLAQTGTGKTAAFGLPMLHLIDFNLPETQGLILCPTRELCLQITGDLNQYAAHFKRAGIVAVYGGASIPDQIRKIRKGAQIIVATPGRLIDLMQRKAVRLHNVRYVVLDEADEMLNMGFQEDIDDILKQTPVRKHVWLFSATMPKAAVQIADNYMNAPVEITIGGRNKGAENIAHTCHVIREKDRYTALKRIVDYVPDFFGLIFCRTREETRQVAEKLVKDGYNADALHGDLSQAQRNHVMKKFREKSLQVLVATDVAARGLDVDDITHVIHYRLPDESERYTHRSGRTARAGKSGDAIVLVNTKEVRKIRDLERENGIRFVFDKLPDGCAICEKQIETMIGKMVQQDVNRKEIEQYLPAIYDALSGYSREELIQRFVSAEVSRFLEDYKDAGDISVSPKKVHDKPARPVRRSRYKTQRFFINVGRMDKLKEGAILRLVCDNAAISSDKVGNIDMKREFSFFEIEKSVAGKVLKSLKGASLDGRQVHVNYVDQTKEKTGIRKTKPKFRKKRSSPVKAAARQ